MKIVFLSVIFMNGSFVIFGIWQTNEDHDWEDFVSRFRSVEMPFEINWQNQGQLFKNKILIDNLEIIKFIQVPSKGVEIAVTTLYAIGKIQLNANYAGFICEAEDGTGGINDTYYLMIFNQKGGLKEKLIFAQFVSDCSFLNSISGRISKEDIIISRRRFDIDCDSGTQILSYESFQTIKIDSLINSN